MVVFQVSAPRLAWTNHKGRDAERDSWEEAIHGRMPSALRSSKASHLRCLHPKPRRYGGPCTGSADRFESIRASTGARKRPPVPAETHHDEVAGEFLEELEHYGRIIMHRYRPTAVPMKAYPIDAYPAKSRQAASIMLMIMNNLDPPSLNSLMS